LILDINFGVCYNEITLDRVIFMERQFKNLKSIWMPHKTVVFCGYIADKTNLTEAVFEFLDI
jgi:hypothetical protein